MGRLIKYDNEQDMRAMVRDTVEFITAETDRIVEQEGKMEDVTWYLLVSQNLALSFVSNVLGQLRLKQALSMADYDRKHTQNQGADGGHLPVNGPDFFRGIKP